MMAAKTEHIIDESKVKERLVWHKEPLPDTGVKAEDLTFGYLYIFNDGSNPRFVEGGVTPKEIAEFCAKAKIPFKPQP